jgi:hypothetical protein
VASRLLARLAQRTKVSLSPPVLGAVPLSAGCRLRRGAGARSWCSTRAREVPFEEVQLAEQAAMPMADRLVLASSWNRLAGEITGLAAQALRDG